MVYHWQEPQKTLRLLTDSDWATCKQTRRSKSGGMILSGDHVVHYWCKMQDRIALSSGEAELKSVCKGVAELLLMRNIVSFLRGAPPKLVSNLDASACKGIVLRQGAGQVKHLTTRQLWVQETVRDYEVQVEKVSRDDNLSDFLCSPNKELEHNTRLAEFGCTDRQITLK